MVDGEHTIISRIPRERLNQITQQRSAWWLLITIDRAGDGDVVYRKVDRQRRPKWAPRTVASAIRVANFIPEAAAY